MPPLALRVGQTATATAGVLGRGLVPGDPEERRDSQSWGEEMAGHQGQHSHLGAQAQGTSTRAQRGWEQSRGSPDVSQCRWLWTDGQGQGLLEVE